MLNLATIKTIQSKRAWPSVTITLPTYRTSPDNQKDSIRLKNQVKEAVERLQNEFGKRETADLVAQIEALADAVDHEYNLDGLVIFASSDYAELFKLPYRLPERVAIDNNFLTRDLVFAMKRSPLYWLAVLSEQGTRLFIAQKDQLQEVHAYGFPMSVSSEAASANPSQDISHVRDQIMTDLMRQAGQGIDEALKNLPAPVVVAGVDRNIGHYKDGAANQADVLLYVAGGYTDQSEHELGQLIWPQVKDVLAEARQQIFADVGNARGNNRFLGGLNECWKAAVDGRIDTLLVGEDLSIPACLSEDGRSVEPIDNPAAAGENAYADIIDEMIEHVMAADGKVVFVDAGSLSEFNPQRDLAAITRY